MHQEAPAPSPALTAAAARQGGPARRRVKLAASIALLVGAGVAPLFIFGGSDQGNVDAAEWRDAAAQLCVLADAVAEGRVSDGADLFAEHIHGPIHSLADRTSDLDRSAAADLLRAKTTIEDAFDHGEIAMGQVERLLDSFFAAMVTVGATSVDCNR